MHVSTCFTFLILLPLLGKANDFFNQTIRTKRLYNPLVQLVSFPNDPCTGSVTRWKWKRFLREKNIQILQLDWDLLQLWWMCWNNWKLCGWQMCSGVWCVLRHSVILCWLCERTKNWIFPECQVVVEMFHRTQHISRTLVILVLSKQQLPVPTLSRRWTWRFATSDWSLSTSSWQQPSHPPAMSAL